MKIHISKNREEGEVQEQPDGSVQWPRSCGGLARHEERTRLLLQIEGIGDNEQREIKGLFAALSSLEKEKEICKVRRNF